MNRIIIILCSCMLWVSAVFAANSESVVYKVSENAYTVDVGRDSGNFIALGEKRLNSGTYPTWSIPNDSVYQSFTFLKFDVGENYNCDSSILSVYNNFSIDYGDTSSKTTKVWYIADDSWDPATLTFNTMPDIASAPVLNEKYIPFEVSNPDYSNYYDLDGYGWFDFDISGINQYDQDGTISIALGSSLPNPGPELLIDAGYERDFAALEYGIDHAAYLTVSNSVEGQPVPEPGTMAMLGTGLLGVIGFEIKRRRAMK